MKALTPMKTPALALLLVPALVCAQARNDHALNDGQVHFRVPADWSVMMEKKDGNPQALVFNVPDPSADGSEDSASVTVKTRRLKSAADFAGAVQAEFDLSRAQTGYKRDDASDSSTVHRYLVQRGATRYLVRDRFVLRSDIAVQVRCQRPLIDGTPASWANGFDADCDRVNASLD